MLHIEIMRFLWGVESFGLVYECVKEGFAIDPLCD